MQPVHCVHHATMQLSLQQQLWPIRKVSPEMQWERNVHVTLNQQTCIMQDDELHC